ncbi:MAG: DUF1648 domain-containing protein [Phycisphaeraceae bacterium]|nr:DUF1648 domain-containing protein [Phycisphaeraceae bacterium]
MGVAQQLAFLTLSTIFLAQLILTAVCWWLPILARRGLLLGVTVDPDFTDTPEAADIIRHFRRRVLAVGVLSVLGMLAVAVAILRWPAALLLALLVVTPIQLILVACVYLLARRRVLPHAAPESLVREAVVRPRRVAMPGGWPVHAGPYVICILAGLLALALADRMPSSLPMHWNIQGQVDAWAPRSTASLLMMPVMGIWICLLLTALGLTLVRAPMRGPQTPQAEQRHRLMLWILPLVAYAMAASMAWLALAPAFLSPGHSPMGYLLPLLVLDPLMIIVIGLIIARIMRLEDRAGKCASRGDGTPDRCWKLGVIYFNPDDPALWVEKRFGIGWTTNMARPASWFAFVVLLLWGAGAIAIASWPVMTYTPTPTTQRRVLPAFEPDPDVLGRWVSVDFVEKIDQFKPGTRYSQVDLFLRSLTFEPDGRVQWQPDDKHVWSRGRIFSFKGPDAHYEIRQLDGRPYLFMQWISGDVTIRGMEPKYYVLARDDAAATTQASEFE